MKRLIYSISLLFLLNGCTSKVDFPPVVIPPVIASAELLISELCTAINTNAQANSTRTHYVELYNGTNADVSLANYAIGYMAVTDTFTLSNWNFTASTSFITFSRTLAKGKCYVIASPAADATVIKSDTLWGTTSTLSASASSPLQLSGNSAIALLKKDPTGTFNLSGTLYRIVDVFGSPLLSRVTSRGAASARNNIMWTFAGETMDTRNRVISRKSTVKNPTSDWTISRGTTASDSQWQILGDRIWDYSNLGLPTL